MGGTRYLNAAFKTYHHSRPRLYGDPIDLEEEMIDNSRDGLRMYHQPGRVPIPWCPHCKRTKEDCDRIKDEIQDSQEIGSCAFGPDCDGSKCYDDETEYPLPMDMLQGITQGITSGELQMMLISPNDTANDRAQDKPTAPPQGGGQG